MNRGDTATYQGYEVALWPLEYVNITADPYSSNHEIVGVANSGLWDNGWYQTQIRELYAPFTMELIASYPTGTANGHTQLWRSVNPVWIPGSNNPEYVSFAVGHSDTLYYNNVGDIAPQGEHFYDTGTFGIGTGAHTHFILEIGQRTSMFPTGYCQALGANIWYSPNAPTDIADIFYLTGAEDIVRDWGLDWKTYEGAITRFNIAMIYYMLLNKKRRLKSLVRV